MKKGDIIIHKGKERTVRTINKNFVNGEIFLRLESLEDNKIGEKIPLSAVEKTIKPEKAEPEKAEPEKAEPEKAEPEKAGHEKAKPAKEVGRDYSDIEQSRKIYEAATGRALAVGYKNKKDWIDKKISETTGADADDKKAVLAKLDFEQLAEFAVRMTLGIDPSEYANAKDLLDDVCKKLEL